MLLRVWRMSTAASVAPSTKAGMSMRVRFARGFSRKGIKPEAGSQPSRTEKNRMSMMPTQRRYWTGTGSLRPYFSRTSASPASSASVPAMTRAGSPGIMRTPVKTIMLIIARVTIEMAMRWIRYSSTASHASGGAPRWCAARRHLPLLPGRALDADEAVGHRLVALEGLRKRDDVVRVIDVDDVAAGEGELVDGLLVQRGALGQVADLARPVQDHVHALVAGLRGVQRGAAGVKLEDVRVRVHPPAPADQEGLVLARVIVVERRGELGG